MSTRYTSDDELTSVANAIRSKTGSNSTIIWPTGFVSEINGISSGTDTSDATATAADILSGKTAYISTGKVSGSYVPLNTADANATAADILEGKTAYVNGIKITGTLIYPSYVALNEATPAQISAVAKAGLGAAYWAVGDKTASISISAFGNMEATSISAFIIGFNHNSSVEGNGIHFIIGKNADNKQLSLCDSGYFTDKTSGTWFNMNNSTSNSGGWESSRMRTTICAALYNALPSAWQNIITNCTKYTDNTGGGSNTAAYVTSTSDKIFLPSEWEIHGARTNANSEEQNHQAQYAYYANSGSKVYYKSNDISNVSGYWTRSPVASSSSDFCRVNGSGQSVTYAANRSMGFTPCFKVA